MKLHINISIVSLMAVLLAAAPAFAADTKQMRIKKCRDAQGNWHYGDRADEECARSKVIELDQRGVKRKEIAAPLTESELKAREANREAMEEKKRREAEQKKRDEQLLASYTHEDDIVYISKRKTAEIDAQISSAEETLKSLHKSEERLQKQAADEQRISKKLSPRTQEALTSNKSQIQLQEGKIRDMKAEQQRLITKYQADLERFRELKRRAPGKAPTKTPTAAGQPVPAKK